MSSSFQSVELSQNSSFGINLSKTENDEGCDYYGSTSGSGFISKTAKTKMKKKTTWRTYSPVKIFSVVAMLALVIMAMTLSPKPFLLKKGLQRSEKVTSSSMMADDRPQGMMDVIENDVKSNGNSHINNDGEDELVWDEYNFPDMTDLREHYDDVWGTPKDSEKQRRLMEADKDGWIRRNVHITGHNGHYYKMKFKGRVAKDVYTHNLEDDEDLKKFGCTKNGMALEYETERGADRVMKQLQVKLGDDSVDKVLVSGNQLFRCPKSEEPEELLKAHGYHELGINPKETHLGQAVRRVISVKKNNINSVESDPTKEKHKPHLVLETSYADMADLFEDLDFSGETDMLGRESELKRKKRERKRELMPQLQDEEYRKKYYYPTTKLESAHVEIQEMEKMRRRLGWFSRVANFVLNKVIKPIVRFIVDAVRSIVDYVKAVVATIIQPVLAFLGSLIPELLNKSGETGANVSESESNELFAINYDDTYRQVPGRAKRIWEIDTHGATLGPTIDVNSKLQVGVFARGKIACTNCFGRVYDGSLRWHVIIGGKNLVLIEMVSTFSVEASLELDANIAIATEVTLASPSFPIPIIGARLGPLTVGFGLTVSATLGLEWEASGFFFKYHMIGTQNFGVRASLVNGVNMIRDGSFSRTQEGPLIKNSAKASVYFLPYLELSLFSVVAIGAGYQPKFSFIMNPSQRPQSCVLDWKITFDAEIVLGAWVGLKTDFGMFRLAGFSKTFSIIPTVTLFTGCLSSSDANALKAISGVSFNSGDFDHVRNVAAGSENAAYYNGFITPFDQNKQTVTNAHPMVSTFPPDEIKWVVGANRLCADACATQSGYVRYPPSHEGLAICAVNYDSKGWRSGHNSGGGKCKIATESSHTEATGNNYYCMCVKSGTENNFSWEPIDRGYRTGNCQVTCEKNRKYAVASGTYSPSSNQNKVFYVCGKYSNGQTYIGFNVGPVDAMYGTQCAMSLNGRHLPYSFDCLCGTPQEPIAPPVQWVRQEEGVSCAETCEITGQFPSYTDATTINAGQLNEYTETFFVCRRTSRYWYYYPGWTGMRSDTKQFTECAGSRSDDKWDSCLCSSNLGSYVQWFDVSASGTTCEDACGSQDLYPISIYPGSGATGELCAGQINGVWKSGDAGNGKCLVSGTGGGEKFPYRCACSPVELKDFENWSFLKLARN